MKAIVVAVCALGIVPLCLNGCAADAAPNGAASTFELPVGDISLDDDVSKVERLIGSAFRDGVRNGAQACYVNALVRRPGLRGELSYTLRTPPGEGYYLATITASDAIGDDIRQCVREILEHDFYHYATHPSFSGLEGTLRFTPHTIAAPAPPDAAQRAERVAQYYARQSIVRLVGVQWEDTPFPYSADGREITRRDDYRADLVFTEDGYETACRHYAETKVFGTAPYISRAAGTSCKSTARHAGEHLSDTGSVSYRLIYYPKVASAWQPVGE